MLRLFILAAIAAVAVSLAPRPASAQLLGRIKQQTTDKLKEKKKEADDKVVAATGKVVDSVAEKSARGVDSAVTKGTNALSTAVDRTEQAVAGAVKGGNGESALAKELATGHVVLTDIRFADDGSIAPASLGTIRTLAKLMKETTDTWVVEGHMAATTGDQVLTDSRAKAIKAALVDAGVDASHVWARGFGSTRPPATAGALADRIEIVRMN
jgi:outer membrane protein OmpA-like peptidoglycan-associated protein